MPKNNLTIGSMVFYVNSGIRKGIITEITTYRGEWYYSIYNFQYEESDGAHESDVFLTKTAALERAIERIKEEAAEMTEDDVGISTFFQNKYEIGSIVYCLRSGRIKRGKIQAIGDGNPYSSMKVYGVIFNTPKDMLGRKNYSIVEESDIFATETEAAEAARERNKSSKGNSDA